MTEFKSEKAQNKSQLYRNYNQKWERVKFIFAQKPELTTVLATIVVLIIFSILGGRKFASYRNFTSTFTLTSELGLIALGEAFLLITGDFDLSVAGVYALAGAVFAYSSGFMPSGIAIILALLISGLIGYINAKFVVKLKLPAFIVTLAMMLITRGTLMFVSGGRNIEYKGDSFALVILSKIFWNRIRPSHLWFVAITIILFIILKKTKYGNWCFATGGNEGAARKQGVQVDKVKSINFILCAILAGFAGIIAISRFRFANVAFGQLIGLEAIAGAVIGGNSLSGGYGTMIGAALGAFIMVVIRSGIVYAGVPGYFYQAILGIILLIASFTNAKVKDLWSS